MTDQWDTGDEEAFGEDFFASLEAAADPDARGGEAAGSDDVFDGAAGSDEFQFESAFQYESESDGSFETEAEDPAADPVGAPASDPADVFADDFDAEDFPYDLGGEG
ncbi:hypothetical protein [Glycomyces albidus]|uniref:Uncharacterized protein n=1 Tax=Glycomyces albidus TaxID=2656774 RepID=A0A6L5GDB8_9ACTN|nr:hypothetical protein [Glycomyces albidus]MQM27692.1 hypothetical protein [Glycomyces albidus]